MAIIITVVTLGRESTEEEKISRQQFIESAVANETTNGQVAGRPPGGFEPGVRVWSTVEAANAFITHMNSFVPPPVQAIVTTI